MVIGARARAREN